MLKEIRERLANPVWRRVRTVLLCDVRFIDSFSSSAYELRWFTSAIHRVPQDGAWILKLKPSKVVATSWW